MLFFFFLSLLSLSLSLPSPSPQYGSVPSSSTTLSSNSNSTAPAPQDPIFAFFPSGTILSATQSLSIGQVQLYTNTTHLLAVFPSSTETSYVALGRGSSMSSNSWILVSTSTGLSVRKASGHSTPRPLSTPDAPEVTPIPELSIDGKTAVFVRDGKDFAAREAFIYASGGASGDSIRQHSGGKFGSFAARFVDPNTAQQNPKNTQGNTQDNGVEIPWRRYDSIIIIHAIVGALAWLLIAPAAVLIARMGRLLHGWVKIHSLFQSCITLLLTIIAVILAVVAVQQNGGLQLSGHAVMGFILLALLLVQISLGYYIHDKFDANRTKRPSRNVAHMIIGITLLVLGYAQIGSGLRLYNTKRPGYFPGYTFTLFWILVIAPLILYFVSVGILVAHRRRKEGMSWGMSMFGLGREGGSLPKMEKLPSTKELPVTNEKVENPFINYAVEGRETPDSDKASKASIFSGFHKKQGKETQANLERTASWGNIKGVDKFNLTNGLGSAGQQGQQTFPLFQAQELPPPVPTPSNGFGVPTYGAPAPPPQTQQRQLPPQMMPGYTPSKPMPLRAATLNFSDDPMAQRDRSGGLRELQLQQQRSRTPPNMQRPMMQPRGPMPMPQRSMTGGYSQQGYYPQPQQGGRPGRNYLDLGGEGVAR